MIIKKLILENIRSYKHEEIEFKTGSTLLAGDIGAGKTTVLLGIEFGLFGLQPGQRGSSLLRNTSEIGGVTLNLEIDEQDIIIERTLKRGKAVSQDYAAITINGEKQELSITELKSKILNILNYPKEFSKKQNLLYKFTVYTPQEEMKQIILEDVDTRVNTLRHVFGIDKYKKVLDNVLILRLKLREEKKLMEGITSGLDEEKKSFEKKREDIEEKKKGILDLEKELIIKIKNKENKEKEKKKIAKLIEGKNDLKIKLSQTNGMLYSKRELQKNDKKNLKRINEELEKYNSGDFEESKLIRIEKEILVRKKEKEKLEKINLDVNLNLTSLKNKILECNHLEKKMQNLEICPTCYQNVDAVYRANILNKNHNDASNAKKEIEELELKKNELGIKIKEEEKSINLLEKRSTEMKILKMKMDGINEKRSRLSEIIKQDEIIEKDIKLLENQIKTIKEDLFSLSKYDLIFEEKSNELSLALKEERIVDIKLAELRKEIEVFEKSNEELKLRIEKIEKVKEKLIRVMDLENWISRKFIPIISFIERNIMGSLKYEFSRLFSEWFNSLVPEDFNVHLSDNFTPIIEQQDYEISYSYLSGGERTAIALAYRLALNQVINSLMSKIKTKDLVILDEPTDGFSDQQLDKMREVLDELNIKQLIIVSHEQKIEGFVENIIRFKKEHGVSFME